MAGELILIVEDNEKNRKLVRDLLQFHKYRTVEAITGEEGVEIARTQRPDLILMDIQLPGIDGFTAFRHLREDSGTRGIPVIAVTASAMPQDRERILAAGFDGYQTKPISVKTLPDMVRDIVKARSGTKPPRPQSPPGDAS